MLHGCEAREDLGKNNSVKLYWVSGYRGIVGTTKVDELGKERTSIRGKARTIQNMHNGVAT